MFERCHWMQLLLGGIESLRIYLLSIVAYKLYRFLVTLVNATCARKFDVSERKGYW